jgi:hypothetical protein
MESYNFITLGIDCQPAIALKSLNLRNYALPFDWVTSNVNMIVECIKDDFKFFHQELRFDSNNVLRDKYGFGFVHDYPLKKEGEPARVDNWMDYKADVIEKYERRIKRFNDILNSETPIIAIYKGRKEDIQYFKQNFKEKYNKTNIFYIIYNYNIIYPDRINDKIVFHDILFCSDDIVICNGHIDGTSISLQQEILSRAIDIVKQRTEILQKNQLILKANQSKSNRLILTSF